MVTELPVSLVEQAITWMCLFGLVYPIGIQVSVIEEYPQSALPSD